MAEKNIKARIIIRQATSVEWAALTATTLKRGEFALDTTTGVLKIATADNQTFANAKVVSTHDDHYISIVQVATSAFTSDSTYASLGYNVKGTIEMLDITENDVVNVTFDMAQAVSGNFAPISVYLAGLFKKLITSSNDSLASSCPATSLKVTPISSCM